jgi:hypothetical protein
MITGVCNIYINSGFKLCLFKETFPLVYPVTDNWLIYIRGKYSNEAIAYIKGSLENTETNCVFFNALDDGDWAGSTGRMMGFAKYDYVYVFLEDHFLLKPLEHFKDVIRDMVENGIEYFQYSFFNVSPSTHSVEKLYPDHTEHFYAFTLDRDGALAMRGGYAKFYPYSLASVAFKKYFLQLLEIERGIVLKVPFFIQAFMENVFFRYPRNRRFWFLMNRFSSRIGIRWTIYSPATPFNLEKSLFDCNESLLPIRVGVLRQELFANWDDDNGLSNSSLIKRGLYPSNLKADVDPYPPTELAKKYFLKKGNLLEGQYYPDTSRPPMVPLKQISIHEGRLKVSSEKESYVISQGQDILIHANIPHALEALEDCRYSIRIIDKENER